MKQVRSYSRYGVNAAILLGKQIRLGRKQRKWTESELAERAGVSRATIQKIEKGDMTCAMGLVFETAALVGVQLFDDDTNIAKQIDRTDDKIALLPKTIHKISKGVDDAF